MSTRPDPPGPSLLGMLSMYLAARCNTLRFMERLARRYGDVAYLRVGGRPYYFFNHPDHIESLLLAGYKVKRSTPQPMRRALGDGLICSSGEDHRRMRPLLQQFFLKQCPQDLGAIILGYAEDQMQGWNDGDVRDIEAEMIHLTLGVMLKMLFGTDFGKAITAFAHSAAMVHENGNATPSAVLNTFLERIPLIGRLTPLGAARRHLDDTIYQLIRTRRQQGAVSGIDLLSTMLRLQQEPANRSFLTDESIRDELLTMLTAGHETISSALAWTWYLLARHPEAERKLHDELGAVLGGRRATAEELPKLSYARMVFAESMRLYPPVWASARRLVRDLDIGGYRIPDGACVYFTQYLVHRDARFHPDPDRFNPERFLPDEQAKRPKYAYFPFGGGNRQCIGEGFAWTEGLLLIAALAQQWRFRLVDGHPIEVEPLIALQPKFGIRMILEKRRHVTSQQTEPTETHGAAV